MKYSERDELVASLKEFVDFLENDKRALELPSTYRVTISEYVSECSYVDGEYKQDEFETRLKMRKMAKALAPCKKEYDSYYFKLTRMFGTKLRYTIQTSRQAVCERVVTGTREVEEYVVPAHTEEIVEWKCNDSLLAPTE